MLPPFRRPLPAARPGARRPWSVAATAGVRMGRGATGKAPKKVTFRVADDPLGAVGQRSSRRDTLRWLPS